ncbi:heavy metal translocating P-type ATPase, partial [Candidatus Bathyarchaeota archaeon]
DESLLTGESKPVFKTVGSPVIGGALNLDGALKVRVEKVGEETFLSNVIRLVNEAQMSKSKTQLLADKAASILTPVAIVSGLAAFAYWAIVTGDLAFAVERMVSVVVVACPHALGLAIPLVVSVSTSLAASNGMLIRNRVGFEEARKVDAVVFDKTGTLTKGEFRLARIELFDKGLDEREALGLTAALEALSEHSLGKPIVEEAKARGIELPGVTGFKALPGRGIYGLVDGKEVYVGGLMLLRELRLSVDEAYKAEGGEPDIPRGQRRG